MRFCDFDFFSKKKPVGSSFHVYVMQVHARTRWVSVADLEKMLGKVPWALGEVNLYGICGRCSGGYSGRLLCSLLCFPRA